MTFKDFYLAFLIILGFSFSYAQDDLLSLLEEEGNALYTMATFQDQTCH